MNEGEAGDRGTHTRSPLSFSFGNEKGNPVEVNVLVMSSCRAVAVAFAADGD